MELKGGQRESKLGPITKPNNHNSALPTPQKKQKTRQKKEKPPYCRLLSEGQREEYSPEDFLGKEKTKHPNAYKSESCLFISDIMTPFRKSYVHVALPYPK